MSRTDFAYDPFSPEAMSDPLPLYKVLRERYPAYYIAKYDTWALSRFADVHAMLGDTTDTFLSTEGSLPGPELLARHNPGAIPDPPTDPIGLHTTQPSDVHGPIRQAHGRPLRPGAVARTEDDVRRIVTDRLDELLPRREFDLVQDFTGIVAASVACSLFRLSLDHARTVLDTVNLSTRTDPVKGGVNMKLLAERITALIEPVVAQRRAEGGDGSFPLIDGLLAHRLDDRPLTDHEVAMQLVGVMVGATETLPKVVGHGLMELWRRPDQLAAVRADPAHVPPVLEEMFRYCGPAQWFLRTVRRTATVAGQPVRPGQRVLALIQSANRDEREFDAPDEFRWNREIPRTLAFGHGPHFCIGVHLARMEGRVVLEEWFRRVPAYEIDVDRAVRRDSSFQWGWGEIPVRVATIGTERIP